MREFKFRAWNHIDKIMHYSREYESLAEFFNGPLDHVLMQYTGLKDKNGVEIYEHDLVEMDGRKYEIKFGEHEVPADYHGGSAYGYYIYNLKPFEFIQEEPILEYMAKQCVIIGNRFQNPELLNEK